MSTPTEQTSGTRPDTATADVITARDLVKTFGSVRALDGLELTVVRGEVHGFLGPNGAGKSTTIRMLLGLMRATSGTATVFGADPWHDAVELHRRLAYVPGDVTLWPGLTGGQCIDVLGQANGGLVPQRRAELMERFDLDPSKRARDYSKGNRQKVALVAAFAADVELLVLDEPTSGLDPLMEHVFWRCVRERRDAGCTVLLSSHILAEVEALADRVTIVRKGRTVSSGTLASLRRFTRTHVHAVTRDEPAAIDGVPGVADVAREQVEERWETRFSVESDHLGEAVGLVHAARIESLTTKPPSLDELFMRTYEQEGEGSR